MAARFSRRALLAGLALLLVGACRRDKAARELPLSVEFGVAPVVDDHPWVIAFLTEISITRPPGADARLEGRSGAGGLRYPEPVIEAETREVLAEQLASYEAKRPRDPGIEPVWQPDPFGPSASVRWRLYFVDRSAGFVADAQARASLERDGQSSSVRVRLSEEQGARLADLSAAVIDHRIAITIADEILSIPVVASPIEGGQLLLNPSAHDSPERGAEALLDRLTR